MLGYISCMIKETRHTLRGLFVDAEISARPQGFPARYFASLPVSGSLDGYSPHRPPRAYVEHCLARGDAEMFARVVTAIRDWNGNERQLEYCYGSILGHLAALYETTRPTIARLLEEAPAPQRDSLVTAVVKLCKDPIFAKLAVAAGPAAILAYWRRSGFSLEREPKPQPQDHEHIVAAARAVFADPRRKNRHSSNEDACIAAIDLFGDMPSMAPLLAELEQMMGPDENTLVEWFAAVHKREANQTAETLYAWSDEHLTDVYSAIDVPGGARAYLAAKPEDRAWLITALETRVQDTAVAPIYRVLAMSELADVDSERALELADALQADPVLAPIARPLSRFRSLAAAEQHCANLGVHIDTFNTETDMFPNGHDCELRRLAGLIDELTVLEPWFEEIPPLDGEEYDDEDEVLCGDERLPGHYRLRVYLQGSSYEMISKACADWLDVAVMLGLLNRICEDAGLTHRFVSIERDYGQSAWIAVGPTKALEQAIAEGALVPADPSAADDRGIALEDELKRLLPPT